VLAQPLATQPDLLNKPDGSHQPNPQERARAAAKTAGPTQSPAAAAAVPQQQPAAAPAAAAAAAPSSEAAAVAAAWKEHTAPDGRKYYYNRLLKESRWQMPEEMKAALAAAKGERGSCWGLVWFGGGGGKINEKQSTSTYVLLWA